MYGSMRPMTDPTIRLAPVAETPTGQSRLAYRLAGAFTLIGGALTILSGPGAAIGSVVIDLVLGVGLLGLRRWARQLMIVRALLAAVFAPLLIGMQDGLLAGGLVAVFGWMYVAALILLLTGRSALWRVISAVALFGVYAMVSTLGVLVTLLQ